MAFNFWESQRKLRRTTTVYLILFFLLTIATAVFTEFALRSASPENYDPQFPIIGAGFLVITLIVAGFNYLMYRQQGGSYVAESLGARPVRLDTSDSRERQLINIVEEMSVAAAIPMPSIYILPANEINAFAAGLTPDKAAIAISEGALRRLNREEVQGVIAHEVGHIYNADMVIGLRLAAMVMGFFFVLYLGFRLLQMTSFGRNRENGRGINPALLAAIVFIIAGALTWFVGSILKATVSRQREYLADATAVQFTRNPNGIANALRKIADDPRRDMPATGSAYSHMYLEDHTSIFATHPPLWKRIAALEGTQ